MAITITSNTETEDEIRSGLQRMGVDITPTPDVVEPPAVASDVPVVEETPSSSEQTEIPGEVIPAEAASETVAVTEPAKTQSQEIPPEGKVDDKGNKGPGKGFVRKIETLERQAERLIAELDAERGSKTSLQRQLDEVNAKLAALQPVEAQKEPEPQRPKRPTRAQFEFDEEKYEAAMAEYDEKLDDFYREQNARTIEQTIEARDRDRVETARQEAAAKSYNEYVDRREAGRAQYEDWDDVLGPDAPPVEIAEIHKPLLEAIFVKSKVPADLMYYLAKNPTVMEELNQMDSVDFTTELAVIQRDLVTAKSAKPPEASLIPVVPVVSTPEPPARPQPRPLKTPDAPIEPLGGKATPGTNMTLEKAAALGPQAYREMRQREIAAKLAPR